MFKRIEAQLILLGITKKELAQAVGIGYNTLLQKLKGARAFTLDEALKIKEAIRSDESIEMLFEQAA
jgi:predicted transcriptional regulator